MVTALTHVTVIVLDQDAALRWYTEVFGLEKRMDRQMGNERWVSVGIKGQPWPEIALQQPSEAIYGPETYAKKMRQLGENPTWVFTVDDCRGFVESLRQKGTRIISEPAEKPWGTAALVSDLYGNVFSLLERARTS